MNARPILNLEPLDRAIGQLEKFARLADATHADPDIAEGMRMAAIQAFEFAYELAFKMLRRFLDQTEASSEAIDSATFQSVIRLGCERGLHQSELAQWMNFRHLRGITSHAYDQRKAADVLAGIPDFLVETRQLRDHLRSRSSPP